MNVFRVRVLTALLLFGMLGVASSCSKKGDSLAGSREISSLTTSEMAQFCKELNAMAENALTYAELVNEKCVAKVVADKLYDWALDSDLKLKSTAQRECSRRLDKCKSEPPKSDPFDCKLAGRFSECKEVTVGQIKQCIEKAMPFRKKSAGRDFCALLKPGETLSSVTKELQAPAENQECFEKIIKHCPDDLRPDQGNDSNSGGGADMVTRYEGFAAQMCECKDKACADDVNDRFTEWGQEMAKTAGKEAAERPDPDMVRKTTEASTKYSECYTKLAMAAAGGG